MALFHRKKQVEAPEPEAEPLGLPGAPETDMSGRRSVDDHRDYLCSLVQAVPPVAVRCRELSVWLFVRTFMRPMTFQS